MKVSPYLVAILCLATISCSKSSSSPAAQSASRIRVENLTGHDWAEVVVLTNRFGAVKDGATTEYQSTSVVFEDVFVYLAESDGRFWRYRFMGGENPQIGNGSYTYVLRLARNDELKIQRRNDK